MNNYDVKTSNESLGEADAIITCSCGKVFTGKVKDGQRYKCICGKDYDLLNQKANAL